MGIRRVIRNGLALMVVAVLAVMLLWPSSPAGSRHSPTVAALIPAARTSAPPATGSAVVGTSLPIGPASGMPQLTRRLTPISRRASSSPTRLQQLLGQGLHLAGQAMGVHGIPGRRPVYPIQTPNLHGYTCPVRDANPCHRAARTVFIATAAATL